MTLSSWMCLVLWADVLQRPQNREVIPMPEVAPMGIRKFGPHSTGAAQLSVFIFRLRNNQNKSRTGKGRDRQPALEEARVRQLGTIITMIY